MNTDTIHPLIHERFEAGGLEDPDRVIIDWSYGPEGECEFYSPDLTDDQLKILRNWLELVIEPIRYMYGEFYYYGVPDEWDYFHNDMDPEDYD